ncbi:hypothetical protein GGR33_005117 [Methylobacterium brachythecii]|uniref:HTH-like domain-containing protein n=1 Tax=Methylobacterium brachythecii TaxID=1176177 RepID=A0A7W6ALC0_9HYPH|nr:hypothetical protein [Methylobacterium brachythecii]GLS46565.1 hypothetical protein GCM10007884_45590 [Methylobacterium brachythecii]
MTGLVKRASVLSTCVYDANRYEAPDPVKEKARSSALQYGRYGYRRITALLRREGWTVNVKRVARILIFPRFDGHEV